MDNIRLNPDTERKRRAIALINRCFGEFSAHKLRSQLPRRHHEGLIKVASMLKRFINRNPPDYFFVGIGVIEDGTLKVQGREASNPDVEQGVHLPPQGYDEGTQLLFVSAMTVEEVEPVHIPLPFSNM